MEDKIISLQNPLVKSVVLLHQKKYRDEKSLIILEGEKLIESAIENGLKIKNIFSTVPYKGAIQVNSKVMEKISTTISAPKILAVCEKPQYSLPKDVKKILLLDGIKDAGNIGTIIRAACAFGIDAILLFGDCVDEFSPKVLRASVGIAFKIPIIKTDNNKLLKLKKTHKFIATTVNSKNTIEDVDFNTPFVLMFGSEALGLCNELKELSDFDFTLPINNSVESLNLALSAGICLWEISKRNPL